MTVSSHSASRDSRPNGKHEANTWLQPQGEMGGRISRFCWRESSLGALEEWPATLRMAVNLMMNGGAAIAIVWGDERRVLYNDRYRDVLQDKHPRALGEKIETIFAEIWPALKPLVDQAYHGDAVTIEEIALDLKRDGVFRTGYFSGSYNPLRDENGAVQGFLAVVVETTERVARERERAQAFDTTLSAIADFAYSFDRAGRFIYVNKALLNLWGLRLDQAVGKNFFDLKYPEELATRLQSQIQEVIDCKAVVRDETPYRSPTGVEGYYEYIFSPIFAEDGTVSLVAGSTREISNRKRLENQIGETVRELEHAKHLLERQADDLESQVQERTRRLQETITELESFSYSISHDLRGPLRVMQSFAQALQEDCAGQLNADGRDYIRRIVSAASRMDRIIQDVLVYSRIARTDLALEPIALNEFIPSLLEGYPTFHDSNAEITIDGTLPVVKANPAALTQCVANLLTNALKFVAPGVRPVVRISAQVAKHRALISIRDNGIGIPKRAHNAIFGIFYRLDNQFEGTGIGLAIVAKAIERMGGHISVDSEPGSGSTFTFDLAAANS